MLKKILAGITAIVMAVAFTACAADDEGNDQNESKTASVVSDLDGAGENPGVSENLADIQDPPENADVELLAENAYLSSSQMVLEPETAPYNIGGWDRYGNAIWMDIDIPADGVYEVGLYYSRAYAEDEIEATFMYQHEADEINEIPFDVPPPTSDYSDYWAVYTYKKILECEMTAGTNTIAIYPGTPGNELPGGVRFINLRSVLLTAVE